MLEKAVYEFTSPYCSKEVMLRLTKKANFVSQDSGFLDSIDAVCLREEILFGYQEGELIYTLAKSKCFNRYGLLFQASPTLRHTGKLIKATALMPVSLPRSLYNQVVNHVEQIVDNSEEPIVISPTGRNNRFREARDKLMLRLKRLKIPTNHYRCQELILLERYTSEQLDEIREAILSGEREGMSWQQRMLEDIDRMTKDAGWQ